MKNIPLLFRCLKPIRSVFALNLIFFGLVELSTAESQDSKNEQEKTYTGIIGEHLDLRTGSIYFENVLVNLPGTGGLNLTLYRSLDKASEYAYRQLGNWELEVPRILLAGVPGSGSVTKTGVIDENGETVDPSELGFCTFPTAWTKNTYTTIDYEWLPDPSLPYETYYDYDLGRWVDARPYIWVEVINSETIEKDTATGLTLVIPGEPPKPLLRRKANAKGFPSDRLTWVTTDNWGAECIPGNPDGFYLYSPSGRKYTINKKGYDRDGLYAATSRITGSHISVYATREEDQFGNFITYNWDSQLYPDHNTGRFAPNIKRPILNSITASDGREITFTHKDDQHAPVLSYMYVNGERWDFRYDSSVSRLDKVILPDGSFWEYDYSGPSQKAFMTRTSHYGKHIKWVVAPSELKIEYEYEAVDPENFTYDELSPFMNDVWAINSRTITGPSIDTAVFNYAYTKNSNFNITAVSGSTSEVYRFSRAEKLFGLLEDHEIKSHSGAVLKKIDNQWDVGEQIGYVWSRSADYQPSNYRKLLKKVIIDGKFNTTYENFDDWGRAQEVRESSPYATEERVHKYSFFDSVDITGGKPYIVGLPKAHMIGYYQLVYGPLPPGQDSFYVFHADIAEDNQYYDNGLISRRSDYGITTWFEYFENGDLKKKRFKQVLGENTDIVTEYKNYKLGIARTIEKPKNVTVMRVVNDFGRITEITNGELHTEKFDYDALGNLIYHQLPGEAAAITEWKTPTESVETKGNVKKVTRYNALMQEVYTEVYASLAPADKIVSEKEYDLFGRLIFNSRPYSPQAAGKTLTSNTKQGIYYKYDELDRVIEKHDSARPSEITRLYYNDQWNTVKHADDPALDFGYAAIDGRGYKKIVQEQAYGNPAMALASTIYEQVRKSGEWSGIKYIKTELDHSLIGTVTKVRQGGYERRYTYYGSTAKLLRTSSDPETGITKYEYDRAGNLKTKKVGNSGITTYSYDELNRLTAIDYPGSTPDVLTDYYKDNTLRFADNGVSRWDYSYTPAGRLKSEGLSIDTKQYTLTYEYNMNGHLSGITYPNEEVIDHAPNFLGHPTKIGKYAYDIKYYPGGILEEYTAWNGHKYKAEFNNQGFPENIYSEYLTQNMASKSYSYDSRGNILGIVDNVSSGNSIFLEFDGISRLKAATSTIWGGRGVIDYDDLGNIKRKIFPRSSKIYTYDLSNNRLQTVSGGYSFNYDDYGNVRSNGRYSFTYNDASVLTHAEGPTDVYHKYDAHNRMVFTQRGSAVTDKGSHTMHSQDGTMMFRYDLNADESTNYIRLGTRLIASSLDCSANDSDGDGIPNCVEDAWGLNKNNNEDAYDDLDSDGVANIYEYLFELNPLSATSGAYEEADSYVINNWLTSENLDADKDGLSDYQEFLANTNPFNIDTDGDGIIDSIDSAPRFNHALLIPIFHLLLN